MTTIALPLTIRIGRKAYAIPDLATASRMVCAARDKAGIGNRAFTTPLIFEGDRQIAYVSYNGRIWAGTQREWKPDSKPLYDNGAGLNH